MRKLIFCYLISITLLLVTGCATTGKPNATPIQLRMMQTRKFAKNPIEIVDALKTNCGDLGGTPVITPPVILPAQTVTTTINGKETTTTSPLIVQNGAGFCTLPMANHMSASSYIPVVGGFITLANLNEAMKSAVKMTYEIKSPQKLNETTVRMRIYNSKGQITDPNLYSEYFKSIGDAVFIQAIEIDPASQE